MCNLVREGGSTMMIFVVIGTVALMGAIFGWGLHATKPRVLAPDMRRADHYESVASDDSLSEGPRRAFDASTWANV
jgi:hypothetical protein